MSEIVNAARLSRMVHEAMVRAIYGDICPDCMGTGDVPGLYGFGCGIYNKPHTAPLRQGPPQVCLRCDGTGRVEP